MAQQSGEADRHGERLDRLEARVAELAQSVEAGLVAQARRVESVVGTARREVVEAVRDHSELVDATSRAVREAMEDAPDAPEATFGLDVRDELQQDRLTFREGVRRDAEQLEQRLRADVRGVADDVRAILADSLERREGGAGEAQSEALDASVTSVADQLRSVVDELTRRVDAADRRLEDTASALQEVHESLLAHLVERDRQVALERAQLTRAFVEELAGALSRRDRRRLARKLAVAGPETSPEPDSEQAPAATAVSQPPEAPAGVEEKDADTDSPARAARRRVRPSMGARPVHDRASTPRDPAAMRRTLAAVRGLGPAKQAALVEAFGSLEELREASDEDLLAVRGIGPALLEPIRAVVG